MSQSPKPLEEIPYPISGAQMRCSFSAGLPTGPRREEIMDKCYFCGNTANLAPRERDYDSAPLDGFECSDCILASRDYRRVAQEYAAEIAAKRAAQFLRQRRSDLNYTRWAKYDQRVDDAKHGFDD